jgi:putative oxidoreductase
VGRFFVTIDPMAKLFSRGLEPHTRSFLRIVVGFMFACHGAQKLLGMFGGMQASFLSLMWVAGALELLGGLLILLGLFTAPVAFVLCGEMAVAYFTRHHPKGWLPIRNGGELAALYCFVLLYLFSAGPGPWSFDYLFRRKQ